MPLATISAALTSLKAATDIVKVIRESETSLAQAELKLQLAELMGALAETKIQLSDIQSQVADRDAEIARLDGALKMKGDVVRFREAMYFKGDDGAATGVPYCIACWNDRHKLSPITTLATSRFIHVCTSCNHQYEVRMTPMNARAVP